MGGGEGSLLGVWVLEVDDGRMRGIDLWLRYGRRKVAGRLASMLMFSW